MQTRFFSPVAKSEWRESSQAQKKDQLGNQDKTLFRVQARVNDGAIIWTGWFEDRFDADAFLFSVATGNILNERALWKLCYPEWHPDICISAIYEYHALVFLSAYPGEVQEWIVPSDWSAPGFSPYESLLAFSSSPTYVTSGTSDTVASNWNNSNNKVEGIGGGNGNLNQTGINGGGSGGGAYSLKSNISLTPSGSVSYQVGIANGTAGSGTTPTGNTYFKDSSTLIAAGGSPATNSGSTGIGGSGGTTANSVGDTLYKGGDGGGSTNAGGGGGGAAGKNGAGNNGGNQTTHTGGSGDAGFGGAGGASGGAGGNGTEFSSSPAYGSGGGGGGAPVGDTIGSDAGTYGGGGGGGSNRTSGQGKQGLIVITYTPVVPMKTGFNMPMLGM